MDHLDIEKLLEKENPPIDTRLIQENCIPEVLTCRESQTRDILGSVRAVISGQLDNSLFVFGLTGSGKTLTVKYIFEYLRKNAPGVRPIYVNVRGASSQYNLAWDFGRSIGARVKAGWALPQIYESIFRRINAMKQSPIIAIDEIDSANEANWFIYSLLRMRNKPSLYIFIANTPDFIDGLDMRTRSSMGTRNIAFPPYTEEEIFSILKTKFEDKIADRILHKIAAVSTKKADLRFAFHLLLATMNSAKSWGHELCDDDVVQGFLDVAQEPKWQLLEGLGVEGLFLFVCVMKGHYFNLSAHSVFKLYSAFSDGADKNIKSGVVPTISEDRFYELVNKMIRLHLISKKKRYVKKHLAADDGYNDRHQKYRPNPYGGEFWFLIPFDYSGDFRMWITEILKIKKVELEADFARTMTGNTSYDGWMSKPY